jgi:hypothetical protein
VPLSREADRAIAIAGECFRSRSRHPIGDRSATWESPASGQADGRCAVDAIVSLDGRQVRELDGKDR